MSDIRIGQSKQHDELLAVREFYNAVKQPLMELVVFFCSNKYDLELISLEINRLFDGTQVIGCETANAIGPEGYGEHSLSGMSFSAEGFQVAAGFIDGLGNFDLLKGSAFSRNVLSDLQQKSPEADGSNSFALMLIDSSKIKEEMVVHSFQQSLRGISLFGGSASDNMLFNETSLFYGGKFQTDIAILAITHSRYPFSLFMTHHFKSGEQRFVVTKAEPSARKVVELNGLPAADVYAQMTGRTAEELDSGVFAAYPIVTLMGGSEYVRSIKKVNPDKSLTLFCAIEEGVVLRLGRSTDIVADLRETFRRLREEIGEPRQILVCDCILRNREIVEKGLIREINGLFRENNAVGFSTFGEQYRGVHINQTLVGIAIGELDD